MKAIEMNTIISEDRRLNLQLPPNIQVGKHHILVVIDEQPMVPNTHNIQAQPNSIWPSEPPSTNIHAAVVAYATQHAGTKMDLDYELEEASLECLNQDKEIK
ncbi:hypothetical protein THIOM_005211 [Candidatus Thiomargarita nelsonii]|uniref:Uncharacterized protein n=1 Tax=Candidatus Thiomargarita nelsonii TaxID=1003181 RepID=A0A176RTV0_9GAMM|nr:hypothetical protein THIOM_005211 [Candidatus Thiomargarita nelsonii]